MRSRSALRAAVKNPLLPLRAALAWLKNEPILFLLLAALLALQIGAPQPASFVLARIDGLSLIHI